MIIAGGATAVSSFDPDAAADSGDRYNEALGETSSVFQSTLTRFRTDDISPEGRLHRRREGHAPHTNMSVWLAFSLLVSTQPLKLGRGVDLSCCLALRFQE